MSREFHSLEPLEELPAGPDGARIVAAPDPTQAAYYHMVNHDAGRALITIHEDGRVELAPDVPVDELALKFWEAVEAACKTIRRSGALRVRELPRFGVTYDDCAAGLPDGEYVRVADVLAALGES